MSAVPGYRIGQAANLAHDYLLQKGVPEGMTFNEAMHERVALYIPLLTELEARWSVDNPEPYSPAMQKRKGMESGGEKGIPVIHIDDQELPPKRKGEPNVLTQERVRRATTNQPH